MKIQDDDAHVKEQEQELQIRKVMAEASLSVDSRGNIYNPHLVQLRAKLLNDATIFSQELDNFNRLSRAELIEYQQVYLKILEAQRAALRELNKRDSYDEELIRKYLSIIDLEETKLRELQFESNSPTAPSK